MGKIMLIELSYEVVASLMNLLSAEKECPSHAIIILSQSNVLSESKFLRHLLFHRFGYVLSCPLSKTVII